jgi:hypothetical protein
MRIVTLLQNPECKSGDAPYDVAVKIAESMTHEYERISCNSSLY